MVLIAGISCSGCNVVVNYAGSKDAAEDVAKQIEAFGCKALAVTADTSIPEQVASAPTTLPSAAAPPRASSSRIS